MPSGSEILDRLKYATPRIVDMLKKSTMQTIRNKTTSDMATLSGKKGFSGVQQMGRNALLYPSTSKSGYAPQYSSQARANVETAMAKIGMNIGLKGADIIKKLYGSMFNNSKFEPTISSSTKSVRSSTKSVPSSSESVPPSRQKTQFKRTPYVEVVPEEDPRFMIGGNTRPITDPSKLLPGGIRRLPGSVKPNNLLPS